MKLEFDKMILHVKPLPKSMRPSPLHKLMEDFETYEVIINVIGDRPHVGEYVRPGVYGNALVKITKVVWRYDEMPEQSNPHLKCLYEMFGEEVDEPAVKPAEAK